MRTTARISPVRKLLALVTATLAAAPFGALAQAQLEEIVVTAQKREQNLQDVPMAVSAVSGQAMLDAGIKDVADLARQVPSLQVQANSSPLAMNYRIRRVGNIG